MWKIVLNLDELTDEIQRLSEFLATPNAYSDPQFSTKNKRFSELESLIKIARQRERLIKNIEEAKQLTGDSGELAELAKQELAESQSKLAKLEDEIFIMLTPKDPNDDKNIIMEIRAGAGGDEASLFASELYRMYLRYCEIHNFKTEIISESPNDAGGYKEVIFLIKGYDEKALDKYLGDNASQYAKVDSGKDEIEVDIEKYIKLQYYYLKNTNKINLATSTVKFAKGSDNKWQVTK